MNDKAKQQREENAGLQEGGRTSTGGPTSVTDKDQASALGGEVATKSSTRPTPENERAENRGDKD